MYRPAGESSREVLSLKASSFEDSLRVQRPGMPKLSREELSVYAPGKYVSPQEAATSKRQPSVSGEVGRFGGGGVSLEEFRGLSGQHRVGTSMELLGLSPGRSNGGRSGVGPPGVIRSPRIRHSRVQVVKGQLVTTQPLPLRPPHLCLTKSAGGRLGQGR